MSATLLCVQEDREIGRLYSEALEAEGYEVLCARDGRSALDILARQNPSFVLLDVYLPRQDGFEILAEMRMRPETKSLPVLLVAEGDVTDDVVRRARKLGAVGVESSPMRLDRLVANVAAHLKTEGREISIGGSIPGRGCLREVPVPELLRALHVDASTGVLLLSHGRKKKAVEFREGWPVSVKSNLVSECFGNYLIEKGRCTQLQLDESVERMRAGEGLQGEILVAMEALDEEGVIEALEDHALEKLLEIFSWRDGRFEFRPGTRIQRGSSVGVAGHPSMLIVEGVRRHASLKLIDRYFAAHLDAFLVPCADQQERLSDVGLSTSESSWLRGLDGSVTLGALLEEPEEIRRLVFGLISIEVLGIEASPGDWRGTQAAARAAEGGTKAPSFDGKPDEALRSELAKLASAMEDEDPYGVLGVPSTASDDEIREAYARLAKQAHPDRFHGASSSVRELASRVFDRVSRAHAAIATAEGRKTWAAERSRGRRAAAIEDEGRRALQAETEFQRGEKLVAQRDYEGALLCFGRAMEHFPSEGEYRSHYGWCLYLCHPDNEVMLGEALEHCREGLKLAKDREKPYLLLGRLYKAMGRVGAAKKMFSRAVEIRPQCVEAMRELRIMSMRRDKNKGVLKRIFRR